MLPMAIHGIHSIIVKVWGPVLMLTCILLTTASAQNSLSPSQTPSLQRMDQLPRPGKFNTQFPATVPKNGAGAPNSRGDSMVAGPRASQTLSATSQKLFLDAPQLPAGAAGYELWALVQDFNNDGTADLVVMGYYGNATVLLGNGDGTFTTMADVLPYGIYSLGSADFNGDGNEDLAIVKASTDSVTVFLGNGDGTFQTAVEYATAHFPELVRVGDFNADGKADVAVMALGSVSILLGNGNGTFQAHLDSQLAENAHGITVADFNADGKSDMVLVSSAPAGSKLSVFLGNGDGSFQPGMTYPIGTFYESPAVGDFNADGKTDLAVAGLSGSAAIGILFGNGDGTFQTLSELPGAGNHALMVADLNGDGRLDLAGTSSYDNDWGSCSNSISVSVGNGDGTFQPYQEYPTGNCPSSIGFGDFNADGNLDLLVTNNWDLSLSMLAGNGDGTFQTSPYYTTGTHPDSLVIADINGDGRQDLAVANHDDSSVTVMLGNPDGTFQTRLDYATGHEPSSVTAGDFNGDGRQDLAVTNDCNDDQSNSVSILLNRGDGTFKTHLDYTAGKCPGSVLAADFNGDGKMDLAATNYWGDSVSILLGKGDGSFQTQLESATGKGPRSAVAGDFNHDGKLDLAVVGYLETEEGGLGNHGYSVDGMLLILRGNGDGTFQTVASYSYGAANSPAAAVVGDFNRDGKLDLAVANPDSIWSYDMSVIPGSVGVLLGNGDGTFQSEVEYECCGLVGPPYWSGDAAHSPSSVAVQDLNGDGMLDLVATDSLTNTVGVFLGEGDGAFQEAMPYAVGQGRLAVAVADFNCDGAPDVAFLTPSNAVSILLNLRGTFIDLQSSIYPSLVGQEVTFTTTLRGSLNLDGNIPTGTVTFMDGTETLHTETLSGSGQASFSTNTLSQGAHSITVYYSGDADFNSRNSDDFLQQVNGPDFSMQIAPGTATLKAGTSVEFTFTSIAMYGFAGSVSLSCSVSPKPALAPTCALNPQSLNLSTNGSATTKLTITTTAPNAFVDRKLVERSRMLYALWFPIFGLTLLGAGFVQTRKTTMFGGVLLVFILLGASLQFGCGGGASPQPSPSGTPPGQYSVNVNATSGSITHSTAVTITVQ